MNLSSVHVDSQSESCAAYNTSRCIGMILRTSIPQSCVAYVGAVKMFRTSTP